MSKRARGRRTLVRIFLAAAVMAGAAFGIKWFLKTSITALTTVPWEEQIRQAGEQLVELLWEQVHPAGSREKEGWSKTAVSDRILTGSAAAGGVDADPSYRRHMDARQFYREHTYLAWYGDETTGAESTGEEKAGSQDMAAKKDDPSASRPADTSSAVASSVLMMAGTLPLPVTGTLYQPQQLQDYDFLIKHFYSVHTSTTADRSLLNADDLLKRDLTMKKDASVPQILIYHTHSQESFKDSAPQGQTVADIGTYLAELLTEKGYGVYHDTTVYDLKDGILDRSKAYNYALEGVNRILQQNPSIQVVLDIHRDGVNEGLHLVSEVNGKPTAQIMFFNGLSQTPEGEIAYLPNPYRSDNLAFSLKMQLGAQAYFPGLTRKIYLKGLRYNLHLRPRSALVEVGAQTNTYEEAKNAMEPLAQLLDMVLQGE